MSDKTQKPFDPAKYKYTEKYTQVLLEDMSARFKAFGEVQEDTNRKVDTLIEEVAGLKEKMTTVELNIAEMRRDIKDLKARIIVLEKDMKDVKGDLVDIKAKLEKPNITRVEFDELKRRVQELELAAQA